MAGLCAHLEERPYRVDDELLGHAEDLGHVSQRLGRAVERLQHEPGRVPITEPHPLSQDTKPQREFQVSMRTRIDTLILRPPHSYLSRSKNCSWWTVLICFQDTPGSSVALTRGFSAVFLGPANQVSLSSEIHTKQGAKGVTSSLSEGAPIQVGEAKFYIA